MSPAVPALRHVVTTGLLLWTAALIGAAPAAAQDAGAVAPRGPAALERVEELARAGRTEEARAVLTGWWEVDRPEASRDDLQRGIWLRGLLTVDPDQAGLDFRRLVVEYPTGPYTARALARIAGAADAAGDRAEAARAWESLVREHRGTPEAARAAARLAGREAEVAVGPGSGGAAPGSYTVQLGAFATMTRARDLMESARVAGLEPRLVRVPGSDFARVRIGRFVNEAEAEALRRQVVGLGFEALVSGDAAHEEPAGSG